MRLDLLKQVFEKLKQLGLVDKFEVEEIALTEKFAEVESIKTVGFYVKKLEFPAEILAGLRYGRVGMPAGVEFVAVVLLDDKPELVVQLFRCWDIECDYWWMKLRHLLLEALITEEDMKDPVIREAIEIVRKAVEAVEGVQKVQT